MITGEREPQAWGPPGNPPPAGVPARASAAREDPSTHYVIGPPRSGTTLVAYLLAGAPGTLALSEPHLAYDALPAWKLHRLHRRVQAEGRLQRLRPPAPGSRAAYARYMVELARVNARRRLLIKETFRAGSLPRRWRNAGLLAEIAGRGAPAVFLIRDPYETAASTVRLAGAITGVRGRLVRVRWPQLPWFRDADAVVRWAAENWRAYAEWLGAGGWRAIRFEDLLDDPERGLRRVCAACGLPFAASMLDLRAPRAAFGGLGDPGVLLRPPRDLRRTGRRARAELTPRQRAIVREQVAGLEVGGYRNE